MFRQLREDARDYPATIALCVAWLLVFGLMAANRLAMPPRPTLGEFILGLRGGHRFGDLTILELFQGEVWRAVTATFVHYGLLHLGLNLFAFYQLGCLIESWYGTGPMLGIYVVTGGVGNVLSALIRRALGWSPTITSGGGSVVVMGLVALCAVVGWRARTRLGDYLRNQMLWVLGLTAGLGLALPFFGLPIIDNWGHACGAFVGGVIGLAHRWLSSPTWAGFHAWSGRVGVAILAASAAAQVADDRAESAERRETIRQALGRWAELERQLLRLEEIRSLHRTLTLPRLVGRGAIVRARPAEVDTLPAGAPSLAFRADDPERALYRAVMTALRDALESLRGPLDTGPNAADFRAAHNALASALRDPPTFDEFRAFEGAILGLQARLRAELEAARALSVSKAMGR